MQSLEFTESVSLEGKTTAWLQLPQTDEPGFAVYCHYIYHYNGFKYLPLGPPDTVNTEKIYERFGTYTLYFTTDDKLLYQRSGIETDIVMLFSLFAFDRIKIWTAEHRINVVEIDKKDLTQPFTLCRFGQQDIESATCDIPLLQPVAAIVREYMQPYYIKNEHCWSHIHSYSQNVGGCDQFMDGKWYYANSGALSLINPSD